MKNQCSNIRASLLYVGTSINDIQDCRISFETYTKVLENRLLEAIEQGDLGAAHQAIDAMFDRNPEVQVPEVVAA